MVQSEIRTVEEEQRRAKAVELSRQGAWMKWNLPERKITWAELWMEPFRISFMLRLQGCSDTGKISMAARQGPKTSGRDP
ncbi:unnamed protein product [Mytilus coruscus]|uniref:Uncharacterized protein n=1 Tax=Mytilus coruscus TaxID=42192 RepID=A0A6J8BS21_MYTCO|nr:unnamed protein product [Mytilus coruscus]